MTQRGHRAGLPSPDLGLDGAYETDAAEIVAESVAYVVCHAVGIDSGAYSAGYVLSWADGDVRRLRELAERIDRAASPILAALLDDVDQSVFR
jgi:hypothetical protein